MVRTSNARQRLLRATSELLWEKSFHSITLDDICERASVRKGSFYYFFKSKSALAVAALQHLWDTVGQPAYETHFSPAVAPLQRITNFLEWVQRLQREKREQVGYVLGSPFFSLGCELGTREPNISRKLCEVQSAQLHYFESAIRDAIAQDVIETCDPHAQAVYLRALLEGIVSEARITGNLDGLKALTDLPKIVLRLKRSTTELC